MATLFMFREVDFAAPEVKTGQLYREVLAGSWGRDEVRSARTTPGANATHPGGGVVATHFRTRIRFRNDLTPAQETELTAIVAAHVPAPDPVGYTVAELQTRTPRAGRDAWARDGRRQGEGAGAGTGCPVYFDGAKWCRFSDDTEIQA